MYRIHGEQIIKENFEFQGKDQEVLKKEANLLSKISPPLMNLFLN